MAEKKGKQADLPGMENREVKELNEAALECAEIRDQRQQLTLQEVGLKAKVLNLMHKWKMSDYVFEGIEIHVVLEEETVKVKVPKEKEPEDKETKVEMS